MFFPVVSPTVIGIEISPGVAVTAGSATVTVLPNVAAAASFAAAAAIESPVATEPAELWSVAAIEGASISLHDAALLTGPNFAIAKSAQQKNTKPTSKRLRVNGNIEQ